MVSCLFEWIKFDAPVVSLQTNDWYGYRACEIAVQTIQVRIKSDLCLVVFRSRQVQVLLMMMVVCVCFSLFVIFLSVCAMGADKL
jgi:hypothetical protein